MHGNPEEASEKSEIVPFYNAIKSDVNNLDHLVRFYSYKRKTRYCPHSFFPEFVRCYLCQQFCAFKERSHNYLSISRYSFLKELAHQLMMSQMERRLQDSSSNRVCMNIRLFISPETKHTDLYSHDSTICHPRTQCCVP